MLAGSAISWQAKKQTTIALSTAESEYAALSAAARELLWLCALLKDLNKSEYAPNILYCDNQGAIALAKNPTHHAKTKHVDVQLHFIRDHIEKGDFEVVYCPTEDMIADITTKALARDRHARLAGLMGIGELQNATPSRLEVDYPIRNREEAARIIRTGITSGSEELRPPRAEMPRPDDRSSDVGAQNSRSSNCETL